MIVAVKPVNHKTSTTGEIAAAVADSGISSVRIKRLVGPPDTMLTDSRIESASTKRLLMKAVRTKLLLIDSWKFGGPGFCDVVPLSDFDEVITDSALPDEERKDLECRGIFVNVEAPAEAASLEPARSRA